VKSRAADALIDAMNKADSIASLRDAARALDRVATWSFWQIPDLYSGVENISHWTKFGIPKVLPKYFRADDMQTLFAGFGPWPLWTWWDKSLQTKKA